MYSQREKETPKKLGGVKQILPSLEDSGFPGSLWWWTASSGVAVRQSERGQWPTGGSEWLQVHITGPPACQIRNQGLPKPSR